jgi:putative transposase
VRLRELAGSRVRYGYRRLTVLLKREGWEVNAKRIYRLYTEEGLTRECLTLLADTALSGEKVAMELWKIVARRGAPQSITVDNGTEFSSKAMDLWAYTSGVHLDFIRPGRPVENGYIESFNGKLRDECLNVEVFFSLADGRRKLAVWRNDYNHYRPHSALADRTPAGFAAICSGGIDIGRRSLAFPVTPPCVRVRTRRFGRIKRRVCSVTEEVPSFRSKWTAWHRREPVFG